MSNFPIEVKSCLYGRGVFATRNIKAGETIEVCPVVPLSVKEYKMTGGTVLDSYTYTWIGPKQKLETPIEKWSAACLALGYGMIYNHSEEPNSEGVVSVEEKTLTFKALVPIKKGQEITHNYHWPEWKYKEEKIVRN